MALRTNGSAGQARGGWLVLLLLTVAVLVPTACVGWFMLSAVENERLAVRQRLTDAYLSELKSIRGMLDEEVDERVARLSRAPVQPGEILREFAATGGCAGMVTFDEAGVQIFPVAARVNTSAMPGEFAAARALESAGRFTEAAAAFGVIVDHTSMPDWGGQALQGQVRSLTKADRKAEAGVILRKALENWRFNGARDDHGRLIAADLTVRAIELLPAGSERDALIGSFEASLERYADATLPTAQHLFLRGRVAELCGRSSPEMERVLAFEQLSLEAAEAGIAPATDTAFRAGPVRECYVQQVNAGKKRYVVVMRGSSLRVLGRKVSAAMRSARDYTVDFYPDAAAAPRDAFLDISAGERYPGWRLALLLHGADPFSAASARQQSFLYMSGFAGIAAIGALGLLLGLYLQRQMRLTRLKNDLIATVSHELKTPLASMRLLVETLQQGRVADAAQEGEYLTLIARENSRLTRLIDNFLSFSRMERDKKQFAEETLSVKELVGEAVAAMGERAGGVRVEAGSDEQMAVRGDRDALVTAILNLLDNAWKYSANPREIHIRAWREKGDVSIAVRDNGVGIARRHQRRIFQRFYQVDQSLTRTAGGCGLGLAIVDFIVRGHHGTIGLESVPGKGSTFTIRLPGHAGSAEAPA